MGRLLSYLQQQADLVPGRSPYPIRLTPGQYVELVAELGREPDFIRSSLGQHKVELIDLPTNATGHNVILAPREDVFAEVERDTGIELVSLANSVTSVPDNVACCEIMSIGPMVQNVKVGDLAFIDFYEVKQGYILDNEELYIAGCEAFKGLYDVENQQVLPLNNYVVTRRANDRMKVALTGTDRLHMLDSVLTTGIPGGKSAGGHTTTHILYEEVVKVGKVTKRAFPGLVTQAEANLIEAAISGGLINCLVEMVLEERSSGIETGINEGDLAVFCKELAVPIRVRGEHQHLVHIDSVLATIDDAKVLDNAIREGNAGSLILSGV